MVSYIKGGIQAKGIWKQDPDANIWAQSNHTPNIFVFSSSVWEIEN